ncbi:hypothetical protein BG845_01728 [Pseudonocardia autotrophica]|uniref:Uncharacterized protein n=1 Tax=Pseudonocardia autotrophica TaxID=2074 RepID=A0A1Y2N2P5_PSEAH|nr:hypothetical protein BG845_01728 [Pseudonocardia autotrophica]
MSLPSVATQAASITSSRDIANRKNSVASTVPNTATPAVSETAPTASAVPSFNNSSATAPAAAGRSTRRSGTGRRGSRASTKHSTAVSTTSTSTAPTTRSTIRPPIASRSPNSSRVSPASPVTASVTPIDPSTAAPSTSSAHRSQNTRRGETIRTAGSRNCADSASRRYDVQVVPAHSAPSAPIPTSEPRCSTAVASTGSTADISPGGNVVWTAATRSSCEVVRQNTRNPTATNSTIASGTAAITV